jgi:glycosyltransferase involved in cell wall biosynthesis
LAGQRPHEEIPLWFAAADLLCLATRSEGWCNVLLEAIACGRPVVSTRVGGNPEIVTDESLGFLVPYADDDALERAILAALDRPWNAEALAARAGAHSWEATAATVMEEFQRVARQGPIETRPQFESATDLRRGAR